MRYDGVSPLLVAAAIGQRRCSDRPEDRGQKTSVELLLAARAPVDQPDDTGATKDTNE